MTINGLSRTAKVIAVVIGVLTIFTVVGGGIWSVAMFATGVKTEIAENAEKNIEQDSIICHTNKTLDKVLWYLQVQHIKDSLQTPELIEEVKESVAEMNNSNDNPVSAEYSTDSLRNN